MTTDTSLGGVSLLTPLPHLCHSNSALCATPPPLPHLSPMSEPGNELAELLWENGPAFRRAAPHFPAVPFPPFTCSPAGTSRAQELSFGKHPASTAMRGLVPSQDDADDDDAVPWLHYPVVGGDGDGSDTAQLPPDYCAGLLSGYADIPAAIREPSSSHGAVVVPRPEPVLKQPRPSGEGVMNFTFFSRPLQRPLGGGERASASGTATNTVESTVVQTATNRLRSTPLFSEQRMAWLQLPNGSRTTVAAAAADPPPPAPLLPVRQQVETAPTITQRLQSEARAPEPPPPPPATTSSVCSGSGDRSQLKRRSCHPVADWSISHDEDPDQDLDDEPGALRRSAARSTKRGRTAEVHNLSERRRRDRINEKMRALQELIPNCNKIDKASMLEEAIEYLKTLQLQVQMMSMGTGLCVPPMMLPAAAAMQHMQMHLPPMAHLHHLAVMGLGFSMGAFDMLPLPRVAAAQFPYPTIPGAPMASSTAVPMFSAPAGHAMPSPAPFPQAAGHVANINSNAVQAEQMPSEAAARGGADAGDH